MFRHSPTVRRRDLRIIQFVGVQRFVWFVVNVFSKFGQQFICLRQRVRFVLVHLQQQHRVLESISQPIDGDAWKLWNVRAL